MKLKLLILIKYILPVLLWAGIIFYFSGIPGLHIVGSGNILVEIFLRKLAHVAEYMLLAFLLFRLFFKIFNRSLKETVAFSFAASSLYSFTDEIHQIFVPERAGKAIDSILDILAIALALQLAVVYSTGKINKKRLAFILLSTVLICAVWAAIARDALEEERKLSARPANLAVSETSGVLDGGRSASEKDSAVILKENPENNPEESALPGEAFIEVPFTSQAPFADWDEFHEEACEEASIVMIEHYRTRKKLTKDIAEKELQNLIRYQNEHHGDYKDTTAEETARLAEDFYGMKDLKVVYDFEKEDIKKYLAEGKPIIIPAAGRELGNPNFTSPGPLYHNLVLVGYDGNTIITNDPGTRKGEGYRYDMDILYDAIHDFPGRPEEIKKGRKAMIVVE